MSVQHGTPLDEILTNQQSKDVLFSKSLVKPVFEHVDTNPVQLLTVQDGKLVLDNQTLNLLRESNNIVMVLAICGPYRTGKSSLLNLLFASEKNSSGSKLQWLYKGYLDETRSVHD